MMVNDVFLMVCMVGLLLVSPSVFAKSTHQKAGDFLLIAMPTTALGVAVTQNDQQGVQQLAYTLATNTAATYALKYAMNDTSWGKRPDGDDHSFPSGHTSTSCASATFIGQRYGWRYGSLAMLPASYVGWSRIESKRHHGRDVVVGCAIGVVSGLLWSKPNQNLSKNHQPTLWYDNKNLGIQIQSVW